MSVKDIKQAMLDIKEKYDALCASNGLNGETERSFAFNSIIEDEKRVTAATKQIGAFKAAMLNQAGIGLSLSPAQKLCFLLPRQGRIICDVSYQGLIELGVRSGAIQWAKAVVVHEQDVFEWKAVNVMPRHEADVFAKPEQRGDQKGVFCVAKLKSGELLVDAMARHETDQIRDISRAKDGPWKYFYGEMSKKTVIKRASKSWIAGDGSNVLREAIAMLDEHEGIDASNSDVEGSPESLKEGLLEMEVDESVISSSFLKGLNNLIGRTTRDNTWSAAEDRILNKKDCSTQERAFAYQALMKAKESVAAEVQSNVA